MSASSINASIGARTQNIKDRPSGKQTAATSEAQKLPVAPHPKNGPSAASHRLQATEELWITAGGVCSDAMK
jgi:hypothetical protein